MLDFVRPKHSALLENSASIKLYTLTLIRVCKTDSPTEISITQEAFAKASQDRMAAHPG